MDYEGKNYVEEMRNGDCLKRMPPFWYGRNEEYDKLCSRFADAIEAAGKGELEGEEWEETADGEIAQVILCDQLPRNCFRGTPKAFAFDQHAETVVRQIVKPLVAAMEQPADIPSLGPSIENLKGEFYPPYIAFLITALSHSEQLEDHELCQQLLIRAIETSPPHLHVYFEGEEKSVLEHKNVIERFGRYPHRNKQLGRENTPEEEAWLSNVEELPVWARQHP